MTTTKAKKAAQSTSSPDTLEGILRVAGLEPEPYTPRGFKPTPCLSVRVREVREVMYKTFAFLQNLYEAETSCAVLADGFASMSIDSMGTGFVVYFPGTPMSPEWVAQDPESV